MEKKINDLIEKTKYKQIKQITSNMFNDIEYSLIKGSSISEIAVFIYKIDLLLDAISIDLVLDIKYLKEMKNLLNTWIEILNKQR